ncbi:unnamed protein product [Kuraishia capsulata CBS 1993]|uniref:Vacuolar aminopeptidase 1 n=1 Tax=Kuraishia capsulata CBS 1993 TaxID=1382522 RepID=W6MUJ1_9ASCO|nr:uncharacterized protein KUCA_T00005310001 [Kuraishia capsulata CBS 1993]CDK29322.1 unnamed protein product [Kuraishia capsulata CBS 1993]
MGIPEKTTNNLTELAQLLEMAAELGKHLGNVVSSDEKVSKKTVSMLMNGISGLKLEANGASRGDSSDDEAVTPDESPILAAREVQDLVDGPEPDYYDAFCQKYIDFTYENPTTFHVVVAIGELLKQNGYTYLPERADWSVELKSPGNYYTTRSGTSLVAFSIGEDWEPQLGASIIGSHIDALAAKLKPISTKDKVSGYELLAVSPYSGGMSNVWWDRDLGLGGRVVVRKSSKETDSGYKTEAVLINSTPHPIGRIPTLAPHFGAPSQGPFNLETQTVPVIGFDDGEAEEPTEDEKKSHLYGKHSLKLLRYVAKLAGVSVSELYYLDLDLFDVQKGIRGGLSNEFLYAPRIDDRICSFSAINALLKFTNSLKKDSPSNHLSIVGLYDNEELGSLSRQGAKGGTVESVVSKILTSFHPKTNLSTVYANSIIISADVTHLLNPNFSSVYLENHKPLPNKGLGLGLDSNGHMATDSTGVSLMEQIAEINGDTLQYFQIRNDSRSGGTIGPSLSSQTGARTIDMGIPQLSMHSIRAACGYKDIGLAVNFFYSFFANWRKVYDSFGDL